MSRVGFFGHERRCPWSWVVLAEPCCSWLRAEGGGFPARGQCPVEWADWPLEPLPSPLVLLRQMELRPHCLDVVASQSVDWQEHWNVRRHRLMLGTAGMEKI